jgi:CelD/BcsL family acetyltransferase involved in cellulose biosynthesis
MSFEDPNPAPKGIRIARISDMTAKEGLMLTGASSWFGSRGFGELYTDPPGQHAAFWRNAQGALVRAYVCQESRFPVGRTMLTVFGPDGLAADDLQSLMECGPYDAVAVENVFETDPLTAGHGHTACSCHDDFVISLPPDTESYLAQLGKTTRKHLLYYDRRLQKQLGSEIRIACTSAAGIQLADVRALAGLNRQRMTRKGRASLWNEPLLVRRSALAERCGLLCTVSHNGRVIGGTLSYLHGKEAFLILIAHDPAYDTFNLGSVALWNTVQALIGIGQEGFHLLWGKSPYKTQFGGVRRSLHSVIVFRDALACRTWKWNRAIGRAAHLVQTAARLALQPGRWRRIASGHA